MLLLIFRNRFQERIAKYQQQNLLRMASLGGGGGCRSTHVLIGSETLLRGGTPSFQSQKFLLEEKKVFIRLFISQILDRNTIFVQMKFEKGNRIQ